MCETRSKTPLVIEFFGLPGSGKTSITKALAERLRRASLRVTHHSDETRSPPLSLVNAVCYSKVLPSLVNPRSASFWLHILLALRSVFPPSGHLKNAVYRRRRVLCVVKEIVKRHAAEKSPKNDVILFDQNVVQALGSLAYDACDLPKGLTTSFLDALLRWSPNPRKHIFVFVKCAPEIALRRISSRDKPLYFPPRFHSTDTPFASTISLYESVCSVLRHSSYNLVCLDHGPEPDQLALSLTEYLFERNLLNLKPITSDASP